MNKLREIVAGPKNRYQQSGYNLDLTYITPRLIAMAFPASGLQKLYRNSIDDIANFFTQNHGGSYMIINLSGRQIDQKKLPNTLNFDWQDHQAPCLQILFTICDKMAQFLNKHQKRVVSVHCNHGKGRTGTIICCFLLYCRMFKSQQLVRQFYAKKRFEKQEGFGVTQPCQIQYIRYFQQALNKKPTMPRVITIKKLKFVGQHKYSALYFKIKNFTSNKAILSTKLGQTNSVYQPKQDNKIVIKILEQQYFAGDIKIMIKAPTKLGSSTVANYSFNTAFLPQNLQKFIVDLEQLSPYSLQKNQNFGQNFHLQIKFKAICECNADLPFHLRCEKCRDYLIDQEQKWKKIRLLTLKRYQYTQQQMFFMLGLDQEKKVDVQKQQIND